MLRMHLLFYKARSNAMLVEQRTEPCRAGPTRITVTGSRDTGKSHSSTRVISTVMVGHDHRSTHGYQEQLRSVSTMQQYLAHFRRYVATTIIGEESVFRDNNNMGTCTPQPVTFYILQSLFVQTPKGSIATRCALSGLSSWC